MEIKEILEGIIPPQDHAHRNGFTNEHIIDSLEPELREQVELELLLMLANDKTDDMLIVETLGYLKSTQALPLLRTLLDTISGVSRIIVASTIFEVDQDTAMEDIALTTFKRLEDPKDAYYVYRIIHSFFYLMKFNSEKIKTEISAYHNHKDDLISWNAKRYVKE